MTIPGSMYRPSGWLTAVALVFFTGCGSADLPSPANTREALRLRANQLYATGDFTAALALYEQGIATAQGDARDLTRFHGGLGLCYLALGQDSKALTEFQSARKWAAQATSFPNAADIYAAAAVNLATAYGRMGDYESSKRAARDGLAAKPGPRLDAELRLNLAIAHTETGPTAQADQLLLDLIRRLRVSGDQQILGRALERLGYHFTKTGRLDSAEKALLESIQVRERNQDPERADPYFVLALLRLAQNQPAQALQDLERYAQSGRRHYWSGRVHNMRGRILEASGQPERALDEFRQAVAAMRRRRSHIRQAERFLRYSELALPELYEDFIRLASFLHERTRNDLYLAEAMAASEEVRVAFQREAYYSPERWADQHASYRQLLSRLDALEASGVKPGSPEHDKVHLALVAYEAQMADDEPLLIPPPAEPQTHLARLRAATAPDEAIFVFHVNDHASLGWLVTRERVIASRLPPDRDLRPVIDQFAKDLKTLGPAASPAGQQLFTKIFRDFSPAAATKLHWTFVLDGSLFKVPWPALPLPPSREDQRLGRPATLIDRHAVSLLPSFFPERQPGSKDMKKLFAGIGDPVYNAADPRFAGPRPPAASELARLPGSAIEVRRAADVWTKDGFRAEVLLGPKASSQELIRAVGQQPGVLHLATHVIAADRDDDVRLAFSLRDGKPDLMGARELSQLRLPGAIVMMAGCASGRGIPEPVGLVGLTRAWLLSGAAGVVATLWPVPDDRGEFPASFYLRVSEKTKTQQFTDGSHRLAWARALREAILEARSSGRLPAATWAGYYLMGRN